MTLNLLKFSIGLVLLLPYISVDAAEPFPRPEDAIRYRQAAFQLLSAHVARLSLVVKGQANFTKAEIETNAHVIEILSRQVWHAFPVGSEGGQSKSKPDVWRQPAKLKLRQIKCTKSRSGLVKRPGLVTL